MSLSRRCFDVSFDLGAENFAIFVPERSVASIFLSKFEPENHLRSVLYIGDRPLEEIVSEFGIDPDQSELEPDAAGGDHLTVVVSVRDEEAQRSSFQARTYRASIAPHHAIRSCGIGLSDIMGTRQLGRSDG